MGAPIVPLLERMLCLSARPQRGKQAGTAGQADYCTVYITVSGRAEGSLRSVDSPSSVTF